MTLWGAVNTQLVGLVQFSAISSLLQHQEASACRMELWQQYGVCLQGTQGLDGDTWGYWGWVLLSPPGCTPTWGHPCSTQPVQPLPSTSMGLLPVGCGHPPKTSCSNWGAPQHSSPGKTVMWGAQPTPQEAGHQVLPASLPRVLLVCPCCVTLKATAVTGWPQQQRSTEANAKEMFIGGRWLSGGAQPGGQPSCRPPSTWRCRW